MDGGTRVSRRKGAAKGGREDAAAEPSDLPLRGARWRFAAALLSGLLLALAYPPLAWRPLAWIALVPWLSLLLRDGGRGHRLPAFLFGMTFFVTGLWWLTPIHLLAPFLLSLILACYPVLVAEWVRWTAPLGRVRTALLLPFAWVAVDFLREHLFTGFPWLLPGHVAAGWPDLRQAADLLGVPGLTLLLLGTNAAGALTGAHLLRPRRRLGVAARARWGMAAGAVVLALVAAGYGSSRRRTIVDRPGPRVLCIQPSFPQTLKGEAKESLPTAELMQQVPLALAMDRLYRHEEFDLVLWAETMFPPPELREAAAGREGPDPETRTRLLRTVDPMGIVPGSPRRLLTGTILRCRDRERRNSAVLVGPEGRIEARFDKTRLTPFGEFIPFARSLPAGARKGLEDAVRSSIGFVPDLEPGEAAPVRLEVPGKGALLLGGLICYEVIFPGPARERVREGADVLVNLSNYAWYGAGMHDQVLDMTRLRAVETRRPVVVATNDGPTALLDGNGEVRERLEAGVRDSMLATVPLDGRWSLQMAVGDLPAWLAAALALLAAGAGLRAGRKGGRGEGKPPSTAPENC